VTQGKGTKYFIFCYDWGRLSIRAYKEDGKQPCSRSKTYIRMQYIKLLMSSLYTIVSILAAIALISTTVASLQQQTSGIIVNWREEFRVLTDEFEDAIADASDQKPPNIESIEKLVDDYKTNLTKIFESSDNHISIN